MEGKTDILTEGSIEVIIVRKSGKIENYGEVASYHKNPIINAFKQSKYKVKKWLMSLRTTVKK